MQAGGSSQSAMTRSQNSTHVSCGNISRKYARRRKPNRIAPWRTGLVLTAKNHEDSKLKLNCRSPSVTIQIPLYFSKALYLGAILPVSTFTVGPIEHRDAAIPNALEPIPNPLGRPSSKAVISRCQN